MPTPLTWRQSKPTSLWNWYAGIEKDNCFLISRKLLCVSTGDCSAIVIIAAGLFMPAGCWWNHSAGIARSARRKGKQAAEERAGNSPSADFPSIIHHKMRILIMTGRASLLFTGEQKFNKTKKGCYTMDQK